MPQTNTFWYRVVMIVAVLGYVTLAIGGYTHRSELNIASYGIWLVLSAMMAYAAKKQKLPIYHMVMTWVIGNGLMIVFSLAVGGYTYNLEVAGTIAIYGIGLTFAAWGAIAAITKKTNSRILFLGAIASDIASFYPQLKQYWQPHEPATRWMYAGWILWIVASIIQTLCIDRFPYHWMAKEKSRLLLLEESAPALENSLLLIVTTILMAAWSR